jgi:hypothetical protein
MTRSSRRRPIRARTSCRASRRCSTSCRSPTSSRSSRPTPSSVRSMPATPSRPCSPPKPRRSSRCAPPSFQAPAKAVRPQSKSNAAAIPGSRALSARRFPRATGRNSPRPRSSSPAAAPCRPRELSKVYRAGRRQARRGRRRLARRGRCRLCAERLAGRPDRQGGGAGPLHRRRHFRRDPASRRHEGLQGHRRHQQGRGGPDLPGRRLRPRRRPLLS